MAVKYGPRGGVSSKNKDWKSYYGEAAYNQFVETQRQNRALREKETEEKRKRIKALEEAIEKDPELRAIYEAEYHQAREDEELGGYGDCDYECDYD